MEIAKFGDKLRLFNAVPVYTSGCYSSVQPFHVLCLTHDCIMTLLGQEGLAYNTPLECV